MAAILSALDSTTTTSTNTTATTTRTTSACQKLVPQCCSLACFHDGISQSSLGRSKSSVSEINNNNNSNNNSNHNMTDCNVEIPGTSQRRFRHSRENVADHYRMRLVVPLLLRWSMLAVVLVLLRGRNLAMVMVNHRPTYQSVGSIPQLWLVKDIRKTVLKDKHPWLFDRAVRGTPDVPAGGVVGVAWKKETLAFGFYDPTSPLRVRLLSWPKDGEAHPEDQRWLRQRSDDAAARRQGDSLLRCCTGVRLLNGEGDWMPGIVLDAYGSTGVVAFDGEAAEAFWRPRLPDILAAFAAAGFVLSGVLKKGGGELVWGTPPPEGSAVFEENDVKYEVDVRRGHKTGFFLDQRENRRLLRKMAAGKEVLDLFSYTGGFAVAAALGGASRTVAVDAAGPAVRACRRNYELNGLQAEVIEKGQGLGLSTSQHQLYVADCWEFLDEACRRGDSYDIVVVDPPSMAPKEQLRNKALKAYIGLNKGALKILRPGGLMISCSCSSHVTRGDLLQVVQEAARQAGRAVEIEAEGSAGSDHPARRGFPEGDYLQALYVRVLSS
ncbi:unnamed protein product [Polarella glacialis]|uniref:S-adenosylmethionine-dependent methyltransferase domain-containing protein n=1 Tax=Polarella glacialis TaxID=89957 RepID=A0A813GHK1_POLGL|nr:unnamed protein product [Polarella glacialis]